MFKIILAISSLILFLLCVNCASNNVEGTIGKEFTLNKGQQIQFKQENLTIKFVDIPKDNRCVGTCVWEGYADVAVQVSENGKTDSIILNTTNQRGYSTTKNVGQYKIQLTKLDSSSIFSSPSATFLITK